MNQDVLRWIVLNHIFMLYADAGSEANGGKLTELRKAFDTVNMANLTYGCELDTSNVCTCISIHITNWPDVIGDDRLNASNNSFFLNLFPVKVMTVPFLG